MTEQESASTGSGQAAEEFLHPWRAKDAHLSSDVETACRALVYENNRHDRPDIGLAMNMRQIRERDAATSARARRKALVDACREIDTAKANMRAEARKGDMRAGTLAVLDMIFEAFEGAQSRIRALMEDESK